MCISIDFYLFPKLYALGMKSDIENKFTRKRLNYYRIIQIVHVYYRLSLNLEIK